MIGDERVSLVNSLRRVGLQGQVDFERGALARLAFDFDPTTVILDDSLADGESQPHSSSLLGGKKWLENFWQICLRNADPVSCSRAFSADPIWARVKKTENLAGALSCLQHILKKEITKKSEKGLR